MTLRKGRLPSDLVEIAKKGEGAGWGCAAPSHHPMGRKPQPRGLPVNAARPRDRRKREGEDGGSSEDTLAA